MLSPADWAVCGRDPGLPGLALLLDADALALRLGLADLAHAYLRYKPRTSCAAGYLHPEAGPLAAYAYPAARYAEVHARQKWREDPDVHFLDAEQVVVIPARLDRGLRALRRFYDPDRRPDFLRPLLASRGSVIDDTCHVLRYKPGRRLVAQLRSGAEPQAALKITGRADFAQALIGATAAAALGGAPLLGADFDHCALATGWIGGMPLCPEGRGGQPTQDELEQTGATLARIHAAPFMPAARLSREGEATAAREATAALIALDPPLAQAANRLAAAVSEALLAAPWQGALVHGDFSADQVVMRDGRAIIVDWDHAACGDPAVDFGVFLARLDAQALDGTITAAAAENIGGALATGYAKVAGAVPEGVKLQHARGLLMLASEGFRMRLPNWPARTEALLARAEALLAQTGQRRHDPVPRIGPIPDTREPETSQVDLALDRHGMRYRLATALGRDLADVRLAQPVLMRHKPGRRALVAYDLVLREDGKLRRQRLTGKLRAKGLDRRTPSLHVELRDLGLDGGDGVGVPAVHGAVEDLGLWLQERVPGVPLGALLVPGGATGPLRLVGTALARLHGTPIAPWREWRVDDELNVLGQALDRAALHRPDLAAECRTLCNFATQKLKALPAGDTAGIHRDFYFDQVIVDKDRVWLLDLDLYAAGDPALDLGNFLAHLDELGLRLYGAPEALRPQGEAFVDGYRAAAAYPPDTGRIETWRAVSLARHVYLSMAITGRAHTTDRLLALSLSALAPGAERHATCLGTGT